MSVCPYPPRVPTSLGLAAFKSQPPPHPAVVSPGTVTATGVASSSAATTFFSFSARTSPVPTPLPSPMTSSSSLLPLSPLLLPSSFSGDGAWPAALSSPVLPLPLSPFRTRAVSDPDSLSRSSRAVLLTALPNKPATLQLYQHIRPALSRQCTGERILSAPSNCQPPPLFIDSQHAQNGTGKTEERERNAENAELESAASDGDALPRSSSLLTSSLASLSLQKQQSYSAAAWSAASLAEGSGTQTEASHQSSPSHDPSSASVSYRPPVSLSSPPHSRSLRQFSQPHPQPHSRPLSSSALLDQLRLSHHHSHLPVHAYTPLPTVLSDVLSSPDSSFSSRARAAFLLTRSYFADPRTISELLIDALYTDPPVDLTHERELGQTELRLLSEWKAQKSAALLWLQEWADEYPDDLAGAGLYAELAEAMASWPPSSWREDVVDGMSGRAYQAINSVLQSVGAWEERRTRKQQEKALSARSPAPSPLFDHPLSPSFVPIPLLSIPLSSSAGLYNYSSMLIAQQMTLLTLDRLSVIRPRHLLSKHRSSLPAHLNQMKVSNSVTLFIASHVVTAPPYPSSSSPCPCRSAVFRKWIAVASILFQLGNWNSVFEVLYGLTHHAVWRLRLADDLQSEERNNYTKLCMLVSSDDNYACYRRVKASKERGGDGRSGGCLSIPYLGVVLKDLVAMEESQIVLRIGGSSVRSLKKAEAMDIGAVSTNGYVSTTSRGERSAPSSLSGPASYFSTSASSSASSSSSSSGLSLPSFAANPVSSGSMDSLSSSVHSSVGGGATSVDSVESDLFGDDSSGSLTLPSLLSASLLRPSSLHTPHDQSPSSSSCPSSSAPASLQQPIISQSVSTQPSHPPLPPSSSGAAAAAGPPSAGPLSASSGVLLNWGKLQHIHALVTDTLTLPSAPYFPPLSDLQQLVLDGQHSALTERQLMDASLAALPRKGREGGAGGHARVVSSSAVLSAYGGGSSSGLAAVSSTSSSSGRTMTRALRGSSSTSVIVSLKQQ